MNKIRHEDLYSPEEYEKIRDKENLSVIELERNRRISTKTFSFLFEAPKIVINQINEMIYLEKIKNTDDIEDLIRIYSEILPGKDELSVTMFIEFPDEKTMIKNIPRLAGIEKTVYISFDDISIHANPEEGRSTDVLESTLQYLKFSFNEKDLAKFLSCKNAFIETRHREFNESARIPEELLSSLKTELKGD